MIDKFTAISPSWTPGSLPQIVLWSIPYVLFNFRTLVLNHPVYTFATRISMLNCYTTKSVLFCLKIECLCVVGVCMRGIKKETSQRPRNRNQYLMSEVLALAVEALVPL